MEIILEEERRASEAECARAKGVKPLSGPRIYYASRTHSQLAQVARELHKMGYYTRGEGHALAGDTGSLDPTAQVRAVRPGFLPIND
jgi:hypothetical protein